MRITKASGEQTNFSESKLLNSLLRSGATIPQAKEIISAISPQLYSGIPTKKIYRMAFALLRENSRPLAAKYHLKKGLMEMGPSGYAFEKYVAEIFKSQGYITQTGVLAKGKCVQHEVDVIAVLANLQLMVECKYHNQPGTICDVKIPLYIQSRFKDVEAEWVRNRTNEQMTYQGCVFTNTRFSKDAIAYGTCAGLKLVGWDYPAKGGLQQQIDSLKLYPVTCITSLTQNEKQQLLDKKVVLCNELHNNANLLEHLGMKSARIQTTLQEVSQLCTNTHTLSK